MDIKTDNDYDKLSKANILKRTYSFFDKQTVICWDNFFIALFSFFLSFFLAVQLGLISLQFGLDGLIFLEHTIYGTTLFGKSFFILQTFIIIFVIRKIPLESMKFQVPLFGVLLSLAFLSSTLYLLNHIFLFMISIIWIAFFIISVLDKRIYLMGLYTLISFYFYSYHVMQFTQLNISMIIVVMIFLFINVILSAFPVFLIRYLQNNPYKRILLSNLFKLDLDVSEYRSLKNNLLECDNSIRTRSLISLARDLFYINNNLNALMDNFNNDKHVNNFISELNRLLGKLRFAILIAADDWFEINFSYIAEYSKHLEFYIKSNDNLSSNYLFLSFFVQFYKKLFEEINDVLSGKLIKSDVGVINKYDTFLDNIKYLSLSNIRFRYSIRCIIIIILSILFDVICQNSMFTTTIISIFTISLDLSFSNKRIVVRLVSTIASVLFGFSLLYICSMMDIVGLIPLVSFISFSLFFMFKENLPLSIFFFLLGFIIWTPSNIIYTGILFFVDTVVSMIIITLVNNLVLPDYTETNIVALIKSKLKLSIAFNEVYNTDNFQKDSIVIYDKLEDNRYKINMLLSKFEHQYNKSNVKLFDEFSQYLEDIRHKFMTIEYILDEQDFNCDLSKVVDATNDIFDSFYSFFVYESVTPNFDGFIDAVNDIKNDNNINFIYPLFVNTNDIFDYSFIHDGFIDAVNDIESDSDINFIYPLLINILIDFEDMYDILLKLEEDDLIKLYDDDSLIHYGFKDKINFSFTGFINY